MNWKMELKDDNGNVVYSWEWEPFVDPAPDMFELTSNLTNCLLDFGRVLDDSFPRN